MASDDQIILYDLPSQHKGEDKWSCFSFNPWKTRIVLNYKNIPYTTQWVEYPDLEPTLSSLGLPPNEPGKAFAPYSSPAIRLPPNPNVTSNGGDSKPEMLMNSLTIVQKLESLHPTPSLHLDTGLHLEAENVIESVAPVIWWDGMVTTKDNCLPNARSREFFARTRKEVFGASLEDIAAAKGGEGAWREAEKEGGVLERLREFLTKHKRDDGPFVLGSEVSYADFVIVALPECLRRVHRADYERFMTFDKSFPELHAACEKWLERDD